MSMSEFRSEDLSQISTAAETMRKAWHSKEFTITNKKIKEGKHEGSVKMTLWACSQKFRKDHYERV